MANPTSVGLNDDYGPAILEATTTPASVTLDGNKQYLLQHNAQDTSGSAVTDDIMCAVAGATASKTSGANKFLLISGTPIFIGPGITTLTIDAAANAPTMSVFPLRTTFGRH